MKIYKYELLKTDEQEIEHPANTEFLTAQMQGVHLCLWAEVDETETKKETTTVYIRGTGHPIPELGEWLATAQDGPYVWHVYIKCKL